MNRFASQFWQLAESLGTLRVANAAGQEKERARTRAVVCLSVAGVWTVDHLLGRSLDREIWILGLAGSLYGISTTAFSYRSGYGELARLRVLIATLVFDPLFLIAVLSVDPTRFAYLNPFLLYVIVRSGIRYGVRSMYLSLLSASIGMPLLVASSFWRNHLELTASLFLLLGLVPFFFSPLVRRIHAVRKIEEERASLVAANNIAVARSAFLAKISHELRSPLQNIVSALDLFEMRHGTDVHDSDDLIGRMRRSSMLLNTQLRDLMTLAKGEAGRLDIRPEPFEVISLVEALLDSARELATSKGLKLAVRLPTEPLFLVADSARIDQVLTNLVINSIRYTDVGYIQVSLQPYQPSSGRLRFTVADTGPGIPQEVIPTLFAPDKVISGSERRGEGSGIGLAIVRTLMDLLGGRIEVSSELGRGTTFTIDVPVEPVPGDEDDETACARNRVLIVDDQLDILRSIADVADELGFECDCATSTTAVDSFLSSRRYDAVLVDVQMPARGGAELAAEIRHSDGPNRLTRIIAMSAVDVPSSKHRYFDAVLRKPVDRGALRRALHGPDLSARPSQPGLWSEHN